MNERERIEYLIEAYGLTPSQFADRAGIPRASVSHILGGRNKPSLEILQKVAAVFPSVDLTWLMLGIGEAPAVKKGEAAASNNLSQQGDSLFATVEEPVQIVERPVPQQKPRVEEPVPQQKPRVEEPVPQQRSRAEEPVRVQRSVAPKLPVERVQRRAQRPVDDTPTVKKIKEIRVFYSDGTFEILFPEK